MRSGTHLRKWEGGCSCCSQSDSGAMVELCCGNLGNEELPQMLQEVEAVLDDDAQV